MAGNVDTYRDAVGKKTGESTGDTGCTEEEGLSELGSMTGVPKSDVVGDTGVETRLCSVSALDEILGGRWRCTSDTQEETGCQKTAIVVYNSHQSLSLLVNCIERIIRGWHGVSPLQCPMQS